MGRDMPRVMAWQAMFVYSVPFSGTVTIQPVRSCRLTHHSPLTSFEGDRYIIFKFRMSALRRQASQLLLIRTNLGYGTLSTGS
jgi:hypothetical protein